MYSDRKQHLRALVRDVLSALSPLREQPEDFEPADTIPWEAQAEQLLQCRLGEGFIGLRPPSIVDAHVERLMARLQLAPGARVLVLGCGPGMYSNRLGARGCNVTGVDIAGPVLEHARREAAADDLPCTYRRESMLELDFDAEFDAAVLTNSIINHLDADRLGALLDGVRRALVPGGRFACEVLLRTGALEQRTTHTVYDLPASPWGGEPHVWLERNLTFPSTGVRVAHHIIVPEQGETREYWSRFDLLPREQFDARLEAATLLDAHWYDEALAGDLDPSQERAWVVTTAAPLTAQGLADLAAVEPSRAGALVRSPGFWRAVLGGTGVQVSDGAPAIAANSAAPLPGREDARARLAEDGWFALRDHLDPQRCRVLTEAVLALSRRGWDAALLAVTDEAWDVAHRLSQELRSVSGDALDFRGELFAFCVDPDLDGGRKRGVPPHRDRPDAGYFDHEGHKQTRHCTCWVSLTEANERNGCMYLVPTPHDPGPDDPEAEAAAVATGIALPTTPGSVLVWAGQVLHWGGLFDPERAPSSRVSMGFALTHTDLVGGLAPSADRVIERTFVERLTSTAGLIRALHPPAPDSPMGVALDLITRKHAPREAATPRTARRWDRAAIDDAIVQGMGWLDQQSVVSAEVATHVGRMPEGRTFAAATVDALLHRSDSDAATLVAAAASGTTVPRDVLIPALRALLEQQQAGGGFGDVRTTAWALAALATYTHPELPAIVQGTQYLGRMLGPDRRWGSAEATYLAVRALRQARVPFPGLASEIVGALYRDRVRGGGWSEPDTDRPSARTTALAVLTLLDLEGVNATGTYANDSVTGTGCGRLRGELREAIGELLSLQADDGRFDADVVTTAVALHALDRIRDRGA